MLMAIVVGSAVLCASLTSGGPASAGTTRAAEDESFIRDRAGTYTASTTAGEASGMTGSRRYPGYYWMIQDSGSGDRTALMALHVDHRNDTTTAGTLLDFPNGRSSNIIDITDASNIDWESIALDPQNRLWIGDTGANAALRSTGRFYVFAEPAPTSTQAIRPVATYDYSFPAGGFADVEATFMVGGNLYLVTKRLGQASVYRLQPVAGQVTPLVLVGAFAEGSIERITGAEMSTDGKRFAVTSQLDKQVFVWSRNEALPTTVAASDNLVRRYLATRPTWAQFFTKQDAAGTAVQIEAVAFAPLNFGYALALAAEGTAKHAVYLRTRTYEARPLPLPPFSCAAVRNVDGRYSIAWTPKATADRYVIQRSVGGVGTYWRGVANAPATSWLDAGALSPAGAEVVYQVRAMSGTAVLASAACG